MAEPLQFDGIGYVGQAGMGKFRLGDKQLGWKCADKHLPDCTVQKQGADLASAEWQQACGVNKYLLRLCFKDDVSMLRFSGFQQGNFATLKAHMSKHFGVSLLEVPVSSDGWSWGDWKLEGNHALRVMAGDKLSMEIPIGELSQVHALGKADLALEFQEDSTAGPEAEVLHEIRFSVPQVAGSEMGAEGLKQELQLRAGLSAAGDALVRVADVPVVAPRGKHNFEFFAQAMKMHGKTQTYTIKYRNIARLFLLELPDKAHVALVIGLDQPLRQGQQLHNFLVLKCELNAMVQVLPEENKRLPADIQCEEPQPQHMLLGKMLKHMSGKAVVAPASEFTQSHPAKEACLRCSHKTQPGFLFPLKKSMIFLTKPVIWTRYEDIESIEFQTGIMRRSSFDLIVYLKDLKGANGNVVLEFVQAEREAFQAAFDYFEAAKVPIANMKEVKAHIQSTSATSKRRAETPAPMPAKRATPGRAGGAGSKPPAKPAAAADDVSDEEEEEDEDYDGEGADAEEDDAGDSSDDEDGEPFDEDEPEPKQRPKRARR